MKNNENNKTTILTLNEGSYNRITVELPKKEALRLYNTFSQRLLAVKLDWENSQLNGTEPKQQQEENTPIEPKRKPITKTKTEENTSKSSINLSNDLAEKLQQAMNSNTITEDILVPQIKLCIIKCPKCGKLIITMNNDNSPIKCKCGNYEVKLSDTIIAEYTCKCGNTAKFRTKIGRAHV